MKDSNRSQHNQDMNLDIRIKQADPAVNTAALSDEVILLGLAKAKTPKRPTFVSPRLVPALGLATAIALAITTPLINRPGAGSDAHTSSMAQATGSANKPIVEQNQFPSNTKNFDTWQMLTGAVTVTSGVAMINKNVTYRAAESIASMRGSDQELYKIVPTENTLSFANRVAKALTLIYPLKAVTNSDGTNLTTVTGGNIFSKKQSKRIGLTVEGGQKSQNWSYGDGSATAFRPCRKGDVLGAKGIDIISHSGDGKGNNNCEVLPSGLGPTKNQAVAIARRIFAGLGYQSSTDITKVKDGQLYVVATQWGSNHSNPNLHSYEWSNAQVYGYLMVNGQVTKLCQQIFWTNSSQKILSASGFGGKPVRWLKVKTIPIAQAAKRISQYDGGDLSATPFIRSNQASWGYPKYSDTFNKAPAGSPLAAGGKGKTKVIYATSFTRFSSPVVGTDGTKWLVPSLAFRDSGGYLGGAIAMRSQDFATYDGLHLTNN
jgi:hypothetical protein